MWKRYMGLRLFGWFYKYQLLSLTQLRAEYPRGVIVAKPGGQGSKMGGQRSKTPKVCIRNVQPRAKLPNTG